VVFPPPEGAEMRIKSGAAGLRGTEAGGGGGALFTFGGLLS
jgi:hypothetical protein